MTERSRAPSLSADGDAAPDAEGMSCLGGLLLTGGVGAGKTTLAIEVGELLRKMRVEHAVIDLDWLAWCVPSFEDQAQQQRRRLLTENLTAIWQSYKRHGVRRVVLAGSIVNLEHLNAVRRSLDEMPIRVVRIRAPLELVARRLQSRDPASKTIGSFEDLRSFDELVTAAAVESEIVDNIDPDLARTAHQIVAICGWAPRAE
jgi:adenylylsulfate kinase